MSYTLAARFPALARKCFLNTKAAFRVLLIIENMPNNNVTDN